MAADTPYEITLSMNAVSQLVDAVSPPYDEVSIVAPSAREEHRVGYDATLEHPYLKFAGLQFKRPYPLSDPDTLNFKINTEQLDTLKRLSGLLPGRKSLFYALPPVRDYENLPQTLSRMVFVDVDGVRPNTTRIRVPMEHCQQYPLHSPLNAWEKHAGLYEVASDDVYCWWEFVRGMIYPLLDVPVQHIREWGMSRREPLVDPQMRDEWAPFSREVPGYTFEDPNYDRQIGIALRAPRTLENSGFDEEQTYSTVDQIESRLARSDVHDDLPPVVGTTVGADPSRYR